jgi:hypothetical protein
VSDFDDSRSDVAQRDVKLMLYASVRSFQAPGNV